MASSSSSSSSSSLSSESRRRPDFESHGGRLEDFDDGHRPETYRHDYDYDDDHRDDDDDRRDSRRRRRQHRRSRPRIVRYDNTRRGGGGAAVVFPSPPTSSSSSSSSSAAVHVYDDAVDPRVARALYDASTSWGRKVGEGGGGRRDDEPWGTYVTIAEARARVVERGEVGGWRRPPPPPRDIDVDDVDGVRHDLAVEVVASFLLGVVPLRPGTAAAAAAARLCRRRGDGTMDALYRTSDVIERAHGVAVWGLSSNVGDSVSYHVDYAELLRYEHDVTVPPLYAGTLQCSPLTTIMGNDDNDDDVIDVSTTEGKFSERPTNNNDDDSDGISHVMRGGEFCVNLRGLDHYAMHGYKGKLSGDVHGGWRRPTNIAAHDDDNDEDEDDDDRPRCRCLGGGVTSNDDDQWVTIPYAFNRGIVHHGDLPHLSAPIESIISRHVVAARGDGGCVGEGGIMRDTHDDDDNNDDARGGVVSPSRVIVGFNVFGHDVGPLVAKAPEHSRAFRRRVRLYRSAMVACAARGGIRGGGRGNDDDDDIDNDVIDVDPGGKSRRSVVGGGMDISRIRENRVLTKLLILAKRERAKEKFRLDRERLSIGIRRRLLTNRGRGLPSLRVADIVGEFGIRRLPDDDGKDGSWPNPDDVHVHLHHMLMPALARDDVFLDDDGLAGPSGASYRIRAIADTLTKEDESRPRCRLISPSTYLDVSECT